MCDCYTDSLCREIAEQEARQTRQQYLYRCLICYYEITTHQGKHYCPNCSTADERIPLAKIQEA